SSSLRLFRIDNGRFLPGGAGNRAVVRSASEGVPVQESLPPASWMSESPMITVECLAIYDDTRPRNNSPLVTSSRHQLVIPFGRLLYGIGQIAGALPGARQVDSQRQAWTQDCY